MLKKNIFKSTRVFFIVIAVILLLIFFNFKGWLAMPKNIVFQAFLPFLKSFQWLGNKTTTGLSVLFTIKDLSSDNYRLSQENLKLWRENTFLKEVARENEILRQRLELGIIQKHKFILASIIGYNVQLGQYLLIDKGEVEGVAQNSAAVTANNFLIGKIVEVNKYSAKVLLISDGNSLINALLQDSRASGIVKGSHGLGLVMEMIPIDKQIRVGETILTSGRDDIIPAGLIVGRVSEIIQKESDIFQKAIVEPAVNFKDLESVFIIK